MDSLNYLEIKVFVSVVCKGLFMICFIVVDLSLTFLTVLIIWWFMVGKQIVNKRRLIREVKERNKPIVKK